MHDIVYAPQSVRSRTSVRMLILAAALSALVVSCGDPRTAGQRIYEDGIGQDGARIEARVDRSTLRDPAMPLTCAGCHGADRTGRRSPIQDFGPYLAPDITADRLASPTAHRPAYDRASLARALQEGVTPGGSRLHHPMPRWRLSSADREALLDYLLSAR